MSRSLQASEHGQKLARAALKRKSLTQKAIADTATYGSWTTINRFFNGKPINRNTFLELCHFLDLDWQTIIASSPIPPITPSPTPSSPQSLLLTTVQQNATAAREALTPRILERIPREVVREKYLVAIARGTQQGLERVIPIIGPAGYGKSTILGDIYDELIQAHTPWVGLILCSNLALSRGYLGFTSYGMVAATMTATPITGPTGLQHDLVDDALGQSLCGEMRSVVAIATELNQTHGRGVLLIDTLDLVINREFVPILRTLLQQILASGTTVVLTCRDHEYNDYIEPTNQHLSGLTHSIDRFKVPNFTTDEIRRAAEAFFKTLAPGKPEQGKAFADNILRLSTDNRSLREILENPLLLALLCDLFGVDGTVPPDLTVSKLYQRYWQEKISYSRADQSSFAPLALAKESLCLTIAQRLFALSQSRLYETFYRDEIGVEFTPQITAAYTDLLSEGVLIQLQSGKIRFLHQTLLEYAIAYWLTRQSAQPQRDQILQQLQQSDPTQSTTHWLPILRQLLAIIDKPEFEQIVPQLDLQQMGIFGALAYAAVSRDRPDALRQLLPVALNLGENHQRRLRQAIVAAPRPLIEQIWDVILTLLETSEHVTASNTTRMAGGLLERWWQALHPKLGDTLDAIANRPTVDHPKQPKQYDDRAQLFGWLLQPCFPLLQATPHPPVLVALRKHLLLYGHATAAGVVASHRTALPEAQQDLLNRLLQVPVPKFEDIKQALIEFVSGLLPQQLGDRFPLGQTITDVLHHRGPERWDVIQIQSVGRLAAQDRALFETLLNDYLNGPDERRGRTLNALFESIYSGASDWLLSYLETLKPPVTPGIPPFDSQRLAKLFPRSVVQHLVPAEQDALAQWLQPYLEAHESVFAPLLNVLADASPTARRSLEAMLDRLPEPLSQQMSHRLLRFQPIDTHPSLDTLAKAEQFFLITVYQDQARAHKAARSKLLSIAMGRSSDRAVRASKDLDIVSGGRISVLNLLPLLNSSVVGVRVHVLEAIARLSREHPLTPALVTQLCQALINESNETVVRHLYDLVAEWMRKQQQVLPIILETISSLLKRIATEGKLEGGMGRSTVLVLKIVVRIEDSAIEPQILAQIVHYLVTNLHIIHIKNGESEVIDLFCGTHRHIETFLADAVVHDFPILIQKNWIRNISAVIKAIRKLQGPKSELLEDIMESYGDRPEVESLVLEAKGI